MTEGNPISQNVSMLINKGYSSDDIFNVMVHAGWDAEEVKLTMNEVYEERLRQSEDLAKQRQEAIEAVNLSYEDLKKKSEPVQFDYSFGTYPSESSVAYDSINEIDNEVFSIMGRDVSMGKLDELTKELVRLQEKAGEMSEDEFAAEKERLDLDLREAWAQAKSVGANLGDFSDINALEDILTKTANQRAQDIERQKELHKASQEVFRQHMGIDFPNMESLGDLQNEMIAQAANRAWNRYKEEEENYVDPFEGYDMEGFAKDVENIGGWENFFRGVGSNIGQAGAGFSLYVDNLGQFIRENPAALLAAIPSLALAGPGAVATGLGIGANAVITDIAFDEAKSATGVDPKQELIDYLNRQRHKDSIRNMERTKMLVKNPDLWNLGTTEAIQKINEDLESGKIDFNQAAYLWHGVSRNTMAQVAPSAALYGGMSLLGPGGIAAMGTMSAGQKMGQLELDRPDLTVGEKLLIATTVGVAEASLNSVFKGAEQLAASGIKSLFTRAAVKETVKEVGEKLVKDVAKGANARKLVGGILGEGGEEGGVWLTDWAITNAVDAAAGRPTKEFNKYEFSDAVISGIVGGFGMASPGAIVKSAANLGHYGTMKNKLALQQAIQERRSALQSETNPEVRRQLKAELKALNEEYRSLSALELLTYSKFSAEDRAKIMRLNQEASFLRDRIKYKRDSAGIRLNKDQISSLKERLDATLQEKERIESKYDSIESVKAQAAKTETETAQDVDGNDTAAEVRTVDPKEVEEAKQAAPISDSESDAVDKQGKQLSLFDETKQKEEAPAEEAPVEEAPVEEAPAEEGEQTSEQILEGATDLSGGLDLSDRQKVGDEKGQFSIDAANALNKALKGYKLLLEKAGTKVVGLSREAFDKLVEVRNPELFKEITDKEGRFLGFYDVQNNRIILPSDTKASDIQEEFGHAMFLPVINGKANPKVQEKLYNELMALRESMSGKAKQRFEAWFNDRLSNYSSFSETKRREEMILGFFRHYKDNSGDFKGLGGKIRSIINTAFKLAGQKGSIVLKNDSDLMELAEAYSRMSEGEVGDIEIAKGQFQEAQERAKAKPVKADETKRRPGESDEEYNKRREDIVTRMTGIPTPEQVERAEQDQLDQTEEEAPGIDDLFSIEGRKKFTYLKDAEVFFTHHPYASSEKPAITSSRYTSPRTQKSVKVKDYFHFRNWYNKMTGNQTAPRVTDMFYIDKNGVARNINTPKPKVDKDGKKVFMKVPPTPTELMMRKERTVSEEQLELRKEASRISKEAGEIWNRIPWSTGTNFNDFGPDIEGQVGSLSNEARLEYLQIQKLNLIQAERLGLSKEQGQEILKNPDTARDILQPSGKQMSDGEGRAPSGYDGDMAFAIESKPKLTPIHTVISTNPNVISRLTGVFEDIVGKRFPVGHYDPTLFNPELGVDTGATSLNGYTITEGGKTYHVVTSVINQSTARQLEKFYKEEAERDYKNALKEGRAKKGQPYRGKLVYGLSALQNQSTLGNPSVFYRVFSHLYNTVAGSDNSLQRANNFFNAIPRKARSNMRLILLNSKQARLPDGTIITKSLSLSRKLSEANGDITKVKFDSIEEFKEAMYLIADPDNQNNVFGTTDVEKNTERSFEARKLYFGKDLMAEYMNSITTGIDWKSFNADQLNSALYQHFNDPIYIGSPQGGLNGYRTFEYAVDENGNMSTPVAHYDNNRGFEGVLVSEFPVSDVKFFKEIYKMEDLDPNMSVVLGTRQRYRTTKKGERKGYKEDVRGPISELTEYEGRKGKAAQRQKVIQLGRKQRVVLGQGEGGLQLPNHLMNQDNNVNNEDSFSIESKVTKQETDLGTFEMRNLTGFQKFRNLWIRRLVDRYNDIFDIQAAIKNKIGKIDASMDFQMKEELMYGKAAEALKRLDEKVNSIRETMKEEGVSLEEISDYLYALHVEERNRIIKERTEEENEKRAKSKKKLLPINEAGSGKTNEWAQETLDQFSDAKKKSLEKVANQIREIQQDTRETMVEFGLESQETVDAWNDMFENYVPLAGIAMDEESSATTSYPSGGAGLSVFGPTTKRAKGRKTAAENIIAQVIAQNAAIHIKARTNEAIRSLYDLAEANPNPKVWEVLDEANSLDPHVVSVRVDGEQKFIRFKDPSHAETLRNMNLPQTSLFIKILRAPSNWLRKSFTTLSPEFVVSNFTRDIQTAVFNAAAEAEIEGGILNGEKVMGDILKTVPKALKALMRGQFGASMDAELERYYEDFKEDGAKTGWAYTKSLEDLAAELERGSEEESRMQKVLGVGKNMIDFVEGMNEAFEDATRLAAYIAARKSGVSREKAAQLAKNITVNFNKHGEWGQALNGVYLFFNASVQGTSRMFRTIAKAKPVTRPDGTTREWYERATTAQKMAAGLTLFSSMVAVLNAGISDEDEDGVLFYDKIPDYVKERNLIIMNPRDGKNYYKIPLPYGYNIFSNIGTVSADVARGGMDGWEGIYFMANSLLNAFSPVSFGQSESLGRSISKGAIPTAAKPFFDAWGFNETYFGGPVAAEQLPFGVKRPESSMSFRSPEAVQDWFAWLNEATGGSDRRSGKVDINPDRMWYVLEYFAGSAGNFIGRTGKTAKSIAGKMKDSEYPVSVNDIPFVRVMYGEQARYYDHGKYRDNETEVKQLYLERKDTKDYKNPRYNGIVKLNNKLKLTEKKLKKLRNERREARKIKDWTRRSVVVQRIMDEERKVIMEFNKMYDELRK